MHPLLGDRRALAAYLAAWLLLAAVPASLLAAPGGGGLGVALAAAAPACLLYGLGTLPLHWLCQALPLQAASAWRILRLQGGLLAAWSALWLALLAGAAWAVDGLAGTALAGEVERRAGALLAVGAALYVGAASLAYVVVGAQRERASEQRALAASLQAREAQLALLKAQVHPHFLFNSLNAVSALTVEQPRLARELCALLADFLRGSLALGERGMVRLDEELRLVRTYLEVEQVRLGERLRVDLQVATPAGEVPVPALLLQPLVENAVTHGIATRAEGGTLSIAARTTPAMLEIAVANPFDPEAPPRRGAAGAGGVGLANVSRRIAACYQGASLTTRREGARFTATLVLPILPQEALDGARPDPQGPDRR